MLTFSFFLQYALNPNATAELLGPSHDFNPDSVVADHRALFAGAGRDAVGLLERSDEPLAQATRDLFEVCVRFVVVAVCSRLSGLACPD